MIMAIPVIGPLIEMVFCIFLAIPFYWLWNYLAPIYMYWLPAVYQHLPFWDCVWIFMLLGIISTVIPKLARVDQKVDK